MKKLIFVLSFLFSINGIFAQTKPPTFCNPLNLDYRFVTTEPSHQTLKVTISDSALRRKNCMEFIRLIKALRSFKTG